MAKTEGIEWLHHSIMAFNGSGYADMSSPEAYLESYIYYNKAKNRKKAVALAQVFSTEILPEIANLLSKTNGAGREANNTKLITRINLLRSQGQLLWTNYHTH